MKDEVAMAKSKSLYLVSLLVLGAVSSSAVFAQAGLAELVSLAHPSEAQDDGNATQLDPKPDTRRGPDPNPGPAPLPKPQPAPDGPKPDPQPGPKQRPAPEPAPKP